ELVIQRLPGQAPLVGDLQRVAADISLQSGNYNRALDLAAKAVPKDSKDHRDWIWLGQVLWAAAQRADVEPTRRMEAEQQAVAALQRAVELAPTAPEGHVALVQHLARTGHLEDAEQVIEQARARLPAAQAPLALAQCYAALGSLERARPLFRAAQQARPDDLTVLRACADFYLRTNAVDEARACLSQVIEVGIKHDQAAAAWARSLL